MLIRLRVALYFFLTICLPVTFCLGQSTGTSSNGLIGASIGTTRVLCEGDFTTLVSSYDGASVPAGLSFQWQRNGIDIDGATGATYSTQQPGLYTIRVQQGSESASSQPYRLESVQALPKPSLNINLQPVGSAAATEANLCAGGRYIQANLSGAYPYQWFKDGNPIAGGSSTDFFAREPGSYTLRLSTGTCSVTSDPIRFDPKQSGKLPVIISNQAQGVCAGGFRRLDVQFYPADQYEFDWSRNGEFVPGAVGQTYTPTTEGDYTVRVTAKVSGCTGVSDPVPVRFAIQISTTLNYAPGNYTLCKGSYMVLQIRENSGSFFAYQWLRDGQPIERATNFLYAVNQPGRYQLRVRSGSSCEFTTDAINLAVTNVQTPAVRQLNSPTCQGSVTLSVAEPVNGVSYTWRRNSRTQYAFTGSTLNPTTSGLYAVVAQKDGCSTESAGVNVTANAPISAPQLTPGGTSPVAPLVSCQKDVLIGYMPKTGQTYQWQKDGQVLNFRENQLTISRFDQSGTYTLITTENSCTVVQSVSVILYDVTFRPALKTAGPSFLCAGQAVRLGLRNSYEGSRVKWLRDGTDLSGATSAELNVVEPGRYFALVTLPCGVSYRSEELVVGRSQLNTLQTSASRRTFCPGEPVQVTASTGPGWRYQWLRDGQPVVSDTAAALVSRQSGTYSVRVTDMGGCQATSDTVRLTQYKPASATIAVVGVPIVGFDSTASLRINLAGEPPFDLILSNGAAFSAIASASITYPVQLRQSTTFTVQRIANRCGVGIATGSATISVIILAAEPNEPIQFVLGPVPVTSDCNVRIELPGAEIAGIRLIDATGQVRQTQQNNQRSRNHQFTLNMINASAGVYTVQLTAGGRMYSRRLIKL